MHMIKHRFRKHIITSIVGFALLLFAVGMGLDTAVSEAATAVTVSNWDDLVAALQANGDSTITLSGDITAPETYNDSIVIPEDMKVVLNLQNYDIDFSNVNYTNEYWSIVVKGQLTLVGDGRLIVGTTEDGTTKAIVVCGDGSIYNGCFIMNGCIIEGATQAVNIQSGGKVSLNGGVIRDNTIGVAVDDINSDINNDTASLSLSGKTEFSGNTEADIKLNKIKKPVISITGELSNTTPILLSSSGDDKTGVYTEGFSTHNNGDPANYFSAPINYVVNKNDNGEAKLMECRTISFDANGGEGQMDDQHILLNEATNLLTNTYTKEGHDFIEWTTNKDGSGTCYQDNQTVKLEATDDNLTLYARWKIRTYTVQYINADGSELQLSTEAYGSVPEYKGDTPSMAEDYDYIYTWSGWTDGTKNYKVTEKLPMVVGDAVYRATFTSSKKIKYVAVEGNGSEFTEGSNSTLTFVFKRSEDDETAIEHFKGVKFDGTQLTRDKHYIAAKGSVIIELENSFLKTLKPGQHTLAAMFDDGDDVSVTFEVKGVEENDDGGDTSGDTSEDGGDSVGNSPNTGEDGGDTVGNSPKTGDNAGILKWVVLIITSLAFALALGRRVCINHYHWF